MGFPTGISGADLCARGELHALKFGTRFAVPRRVTGVDRSDGAFSVLLDDGVDVRARAIVVATGVQYRRLPLDRLEELAGIAIYIEKSVLRAPFAGTVAARGLHEGAVVEAAGRS
jgi:thioredoxin reductase (NADPH)